MERERPLSWLRQGVGACPKMTACHFMMSLSCGAPFTPSGGSFCIRLKSRINRRRAGVDMALSDGRPLLLSRHDEPTWSVFFFAEPLRGAALWYLVLTRTYS